MSALHLGLLAAAGMAGLGSLGLALAAWPGRRGW